EKGGQATERTSVAETLEGDLLLRVGSSTLSREDFERLLPSEYRGLMTLEEKQELLGRWRETELLFRAAEASGLHEDPELQFKLQQQRRDFLATAYLQRQLDEKVRVTEEEIRDFFEENRKELSIEYRYRRIVVSTREEAQKIYKDLKRGKTSFKRAARLFSKDASSEVGGDMGWVSPLSMVPEIRKRITAADPPDYSKPFETIWGWTIVQHRLRRGNKSVSSNQEVREEIIRRLVMEKRRDVHRTLIRDLEQDFPVLYHPDLNALLQDKSSSPKE
ncbi:MAG: peptidylprolyl isomerase, partial [Candidatus Krumholzibacteria bacterium]|nr:peptidylprolyl isomerase [Candidatus Krumholzibacteria bacterium]